MIIARVLIPFIYCIFVAGAYSAVLKRSFIESIAPAFFVQIVLMLLSGMLFSSINIGIIFGVIVAIISLVWVVVKNGGGVYRLIQDRNDFVPQFCAFAAIYAFVFISNYGKYFSEWDEFSHWGMFIKEILRLDALYCTSTVSMGHKDYVPAISLFEALWCKLSLRYSEGDAYRGMQMLQLSMLIPMAFRVYNKDARKKKWVSATKVIIVMGFATLFSALDFYHTVYQDLIFGVLIFYCMYKIIVRPFGEDWRNGLIDDIEIIVVMTVLVMSKMTAMAFLPMLLFFYLFWQRKFDKRIIIRDVVSFISFAAVPVGVWVYYNRYVDKFIPNSGGNQSYDSFDLNNLIGLAVHDGTVPYQNDVESAYLRAMFAEGIIGWIPFAVLIMIVIISLFVFSRMRKDQLARRMISITNMWIFLAAIAYVILMWYLYLTAFGDYEAIRVASFARYMSTYAVAACYIAIFIVFYFSDEKAYKVFFFTAILMMQNVIMFTGRQMLPGKISGDRELYAHEVNKIFDRVAENESVVLVNRNNNYLSVNGFMFTVLNYYCSPRTFTGISPGMPTRDDDLVSRDLSVKELVSVVCRHDYVYFDEIDEQFIEKYSEAFEDPTTIANDTIYHIEEKNGRIAVVQ